MSAVDGGDGSVTGGSEPVVPPHPADPASDDRSQTSSGTVQGGDDCDQKGGPT